MAISNEIKYSYSNKTDKVEPNITYINFRKAGDTLQNDHKSLNVFNKMNSSGNYSNAEIELVIKAKDLSNSDYVSGIKSATLYDYDEKADNLITVGELQEKKDEFGNIEYVISLKPDTKVENMLICVLDKENNKCSKLVSDQLKYIFKHKDEFDVLPDEYLENINSNSLIVEDKKPNVNFLISNSLNEKNDINNNDFIYNTDNKIWFNSDKDELVIDINDDVNGSKKCSGIDKIAIFENGKSLSSTDDILSVDKYHDQITIKASKLNDEKITLELKLPIMPVIQKKLNLQFMLIKKRLTEQFLLKKTMQKKSTEICGLIRMKLLHFM